MRDCDGECVRSSCVVTRVARVSGCDVVRASVQLDWLVFNKTTVIEMRNVGRVRGLRVREIVQSRGIVQNSDGAGWADEVDGSRRNGFARRARVISHVNSQNVRRTAGNSLSGSD